MFTLGKKSRANLTGVHPDLILVVGRAITICENDFSIVEGRRTVEKQREYMEAGKSKTMNSRHLTGHAIDTAPAGGWPEDEGEAWELAEMIAAAMKQAAYELAISIVWGGDFPKIYNTKFKDGPHYELPWRLYPASPDDIPSPARSA